MKDHAELVKRLRSYHRESNFGIFADLLREAADALSQEQPNAAASSGGQPDGKSDSHESPAVEHCPSAAPSSLPDEPRILPREWERRHAVPAEFYYELANAYESLRAHALKIESAAREAEQDAKRYRWLRLYGGHIYKDVFNDDDYFPPDVEGGSLKLDDAIDAALEEK